MSQFLLMLFEDEQSYADADPALHAEIYGEHMQFGTKHSAALRGGNALQSEATGKVVRGANVTDAPFAETKEALGGYYLVEADSLEDAVEIAKDVPHRFGHVEVRAIRTFD